MAGDTPPTIAINYEWWDREDQPIPSQQTESTKFINLRPEYHSITEEVTGAERARILIACIVPLALIHPLITSPYMSPASASTLLSERTAAWN